jgi:hypothetical protein
MSWNAACALVAAQLRALESGNEAAFSSSGRASNEAVPLDRVSERSIQPAFNSVIIRIERAGSSGSSGSRSAALSRVAS